MTSFISWSKSWNTSEKIIITKQTNKYSNNNHLCCLLVCQIQYNMYNNYITCWYSKTKNSKKYLFLPIGLVILHTACMLSALASCGAESWKPSAVGRAWLHNITQPACSAALVCFGGLVLRKHVWSALKRDREVSSP